ncbi:MAG: DUF2064 domain-containing protein [Saprospiraceae bacterium]|nr:DUF2064 domain-containing protein [Saprospiraceae bacterium]
MKRKTNIALLFFSRTPKAEASAKSWFAPNHGPANLQLASTLFRQTQNLLEQSGMPVFHFHEGNQEGGSFGEKISHAFEAVFTKGFEAVIAVGNDTPELDNLDWDRVVDHLQQGRSVVGPTHRHGTYLIGLTKAAFDFHTFATLPWQTYGLFDAMAAYLNRQPKGFYSLAILHDINTLDDLKAVLESNGLSAYLKSFFRLLIGSLPDNPFNTQNLLSTGVTYQSPSLRAPPLPL